MDNTLENGTLLFGGRFKIINHINSGNFGIVYEVEDKKENNKKAIKELFMQKFCSRDGDESVYIDCDKCKEEKKDCYQECQDKFEALKEDMKNEVKILQNIDSDKVLKTYECFEQNNTLYLVMEYIDGINLQSIINNKDYMFDAFPKEEVDKILQDMCETLTVIHKHGYVHRDIKPANIMKDSSGNYKLVDYSTIKKAGTKVESMVGTPHYRPPEYDNSQKKFYKSSDIYSLGMSIYHVLKGNPPPDYLKRVDKSLEIKYQQSIGSLRVSDKEHNENTNIDEKFANIIKVMTSLNPQKRYQDMKALGKVIQCRVFSIFWILAIACSVVLGATGAYYVDSVKEAYYHINVNVTPQNANVMIDGKPFESNSTYKEGLHEVEISKGGFQTEQINVDLSRNNQDVKVTLKPENHFLTIVTEPPKAEILIKNVNESHYKKYDKKAQYQTGQYDIKIQSEGYVTYMGVLDIPKQKSFTKPLEPLEKKSTPPPPPEDENEKKYEIVQSSSQMLSYKEVQNFCREGMLPTIKEFKSLNHNSRQCYWSSTEKSLKKYYYQSGVPKYVNPKYNPKKCFAICITPKSGGT